MIQRTPLFEQHRARNARMVEFGGWHMPVHYTSILEEHHAVRTGAGLFDISHMGRFLVTGPDAASFLHYVTTADILTLPMHLSTYALLCHPNGGIVDDIFVYRTDIAEFLVVVNAANRAKDMAWLQQHQSSFSIALDDYSEQWPMLALQGPAVEALLEPHIHISPTHTTMQRLADLPFHGICSATLMGCDVLVARTGYTGEDGVELFVRDRASVATIWEGLLALGEPGSVKPCGLGARDSLRFEPCLALYGHEIADDINPYEARLGWAVKLYKDDFIGRDALQHIKQHRPTRRLAGFEMIGRGIARHGYAIHTINGEPAGFVTSGMHSPTLGRPLGMGLVPTPMSQTGTEFDVLIREKAIRARVIPMPFYQPRYKK